MLGLLLVGFLGVVFSWGFLGCVVVYYCVFGVWLQGLWVLFLLFLDGFPDEVAGVVWLVWWVPGVGSCVD